MHTTIQPPAGDTVSTDTGKRVSTDAGETVSTDTGRAARARKTRVAVAGAAGYTGQELLRLLARHPAVSIVAATKSGKSETASIERTLPALAHLWNGTVTPLDVEALKADADVVFLALPDTAAAEIAPALVDA